MKAQARKILALIMAMVMCLSLAAPAFAEAEEAPESSAPAAVEVEETEAPEKEEEGELETEAAAALVGSVVESGATGFDVKAADGTIIESGLWSAVEKANADTWTYVTVTGTALTPTHIGANKQTRYTVKAKSGMAAGSTDTWAFDVNGTETAKVTDVQWTAIPDSATKYLSASIGVAQVKGFYHLQKNPSTGLWSAYFKLNPVENGKFVDSPADNKWIYGMAQSNVQPTEANMKEFIFATALNATVDTANFSGVDEDGTLDPSVDKNKGFLVTPMDGSGHYYDVTPIASPALVTFSTGYAATQVTATVTGTAGATETVTAKVTYKEMGTDGYFVKENGADKVTVETDADSVKNALKVTGGTITAVKVNSSDPSYWDITFKVNGAAVGTENVGTPVSNTSYYVWPGSTANLVGLTDTKEPGTFTPSGASSNAGITATTTLPGPVYVTKVSADLTGVTAETVYPSVEALTAAVTNLSCKDAGSIEYKQLTMNYKVDGVENKGVEATSNPNEYKPVSNWYSATLTGAFVATKTLPVAASTRHFYTKKTVTNPATCEHDGSEVTTVACEYCGKEKTGESSSKVLPRITAAPTKTNKDMGYVLKEKFTAAEYATLPATIKPYYEVGTDGDYYLLADVITNTAYSKLSTATQAKYVPASSTTMKLAGNQTSMVPAHYIASSKMTDLVQSDKGVDGSYTLRFYCNCGVEHADLATKVDLGTIALQHSGVWTGFDWGTQNAQDVRNMNALWGFAPVIRDFDVDNTIVPITTAADVFTFPAIGTSVLGTEQTADNNKGTWFRAEPTVGGVVTPKSVTVYTKNAAGVKTSETVNYVATQVVSNIKNGDKECEDGSATIELTVYKLAASATAADFASLKKVNEAVTAGKLTVVSTDKKEYSVPAEKSHMFKTEVVEEDGKSYMVEKCSVCGYELSKTEIVVDEAYDISKATVTFGALTYTGKVAQPTVTVTLDGVKLAKGVDYEVEEMQDVNAGTYPLVVKGKGDFSGRVVGNATINKVAATLKKKSAPSKLTASATKKVTGQIKMTVTGGKVSAYKVTGKVSGVSVNKSGKITVKKGNKKAGTLKVKVTMTPDANHTAAKAVTVKVAIKAAKK